MDSKKPWLSKTYWTNVIMSVLACFPETQTWIVAHPQVFIIGFAVINLVLRHFSKDKISLFDDNAIIN